MNLERVEGGGGVFDKQKFEECFCKTTFYLTYHHLLQIFRLCTAIAMIFLLFDMLAFDEFFFVLPFTSLIIIRISANVNCFSATIFFHNVLVLNSISFGFLIFDSHLLLLSEGLLYYHYKCLLYFLSVSCLIFALGNYMYCGCTMYFLTACNILHGL